MLETELFTLMDKTADAAFAIAEDGEIEYWNKAAERLFGYPASEVMHKSCYQVLEGMGPLGTRVCHEGGSVMEYAGETEIPNFDMSVKTLDGRRLWINMSTIVFENSRTGRRLLIHMAHGINEQKKAEELVHKVMEISQELGQLGETPTHPSPASPLSQQETLILRLFSKGRDSAEVASELHISLQTLRNHLHHINQKLRTHNRLEAVMNAIQRKLL